MSGGRRACAVALALLAWSGSAKAASESRLAALAQAPLAQQQAAMAEGAVTAQDLVRAYLDRIQAVNHRGPRLNAVIALNPQALGDAARADAARRAGRGSGPLLGVAILLKDNIESADGTATTAGSLALKDNVTRRDATLTARLKAAGAVILGKGNLSEWANFRSSRSISGWSAVGGLTRNPYDLSRSACGSSAGPAVAVAAGLAAAAIGTETDGSITCPASMTGLVGLKPTVGLVPRTFIAPIAASQDTAGSMTRTVADAAALLTAIAGADPADPATRHADAHRADYAAALDPRALKGARLGVLRATAGRSPQADAVYAQALERLSAAGAVLVEVTGPDMTRIAADETLVLQTEFKAGVAEYLAFAAPAVKARSLADLIAFNQAQPREMALFGQDIFLAAQARAGLDDPTYLAAREEGRRLAGPEGIDRLLKAHDLQALVAISNGPASVIDPINGAVWLGSASTLPAVAGYPNLTVPMGAAAGLPVGLSFIGTAWSEARLLALGYAFEQGTPSLPHPTFSRGVTERPEIAKAFDPAD